MLRRRMAASAKRVAQRLDKYLEHHPVLSNSLLCLTLWIAGDLLAQYSEQRLLLANNDDDGRTNLHHHRRRNDKSVTTTTVDEMTTTTAFDLSRTAQCASFGAMVTGPIVATWYPYLDRLARRWQVASRWGIWGPPVFKVAADEFLMDPPSLFLFFAYMNLWEDNHNNDYGTRLRHKLETQFWPSWTASLVAWPPILLGTFRFLPLPWQAPVINVCAIVWDGYLSHRNTMALEDE